MATRIIERPETDTTRHTEDDSGGVIITCERADIAPNGEATTEAEAADRPIPDFEGELNPGGKDE